MKLQVNESGLIANLRSVFSDRSKVISELMQNCRRAGATAINITAKEINNESVDITISDDGCGIDDFQSLLTVAQSGWDKM